VTPGGPVGVTHLDRLALLNNSLLNREVNGKIVKPSNQKEEKPCSDNHTVIKLTNPKGGLTMTTTTTEPAPSEAKAKFMHAIALAMAEYAHDERLRSIRAGRERRKQRSKR
jgi:hypothetical protein